MARKRKLTTREFDDLTRAFRRLLSACVRSHGELSVHDLSYAEAYGIYLALRDCNFDGIETLWLRMRKEALKA